MPERFLIRGKYVDINFPAFVLLTSIKRPDNAKCRQRQSKGSRRRMICLLSSRGHVVMAKDIFDYHNWGGLLLASIG